MEFAQPTQNPRVIIVSLARIEGTTQLMTEPVER